jgi:hypothetical protein
MSEAENNPTISKEGVAECRAEPVSRWPPWFPHVCTIVGLMITGTLAYIACLQYQLSEKAFQITEWQQRPWVGVTRMCLIPEKEYVYGPDCLPKHPDVLSHVVSTDWIRGHVDIKNTGHSPALDTTLHLRWCLSTKKDTQPPSFEECTDGDEGSKKGPRVLFHGEGDSTLDAYVRFQLSQSEIESVSLKKRRFFLLGRITYNRTPSDKPTSAYQTDFCIFSDPRGRGERFPLYSCSGGNSVK